MSDDKKPVEMTLNEQGTFSLNSIDSQLAYASSLISKGLISSTFKSPGHVVLAIQQCKVMGIDPIVGLAQSYVINGKVCFFGDLPLAVVQKSGHLEMIEEFFVDDKLEKICFENKNIKSLVYGAFCRVKRFGDVSIFESFFTVDEATHAGLFKNATWNKYTKDMLMYRTRGRALRAKFPDCLAGEIAEFLTGTDDKETEKDRVSQINAEYGRAILSEQVIKD